jgi:tetratricopeptide (TPR) repeat protein
VYRVGRAGFRTTYDTVEVTSADQGECKQPLFVILYLHPMESNGLESQIVAKLPPNFANAANDVNTKERGQASAEVNAGLSSEHDLDKGERHFRAAIRIDPTYWLAHMNLALVLVERRQLTEAEAEFREAVRVGGKYEVPYWQLTTFLVDHGRAGDAESPLNQAQRDGISSAGVSASLGLLAYQKHQWKEAEKQFRAALEFIPEALFGFRHWEQWETLLAVTLSREGKSREFKAQYRSVLESSGHDPWVLNMLGYEMVERGENLEEAAGMLEEAVTAEPDNAAMLDSLGWANFKLHKLAVAGQQLKTAAERLPDHADVLEHLGELYAATGRKSEARSMIAAALEHATDSEQRKRLSGRLKQLK